MKQKKLMKALCSALMALTILIASPSVAFAAVSSAPESSAPEGEGAGMTAAETSETASGTGSAINAAPNTGADFPFPPMAAVLLGLAMVPVIVLAGRKSSRER